MDINLQLTSQLLQAILIASSAIAGFAGILIVEFARLTKARVTAKWDKFVVGLITLVCGVTFVFCVINAVGWFSDQLTFNSSGSVVLDFSYELNDAIIAFRVQFISFAVLFLIYILINFFSEG